MLNRILLIVCIITSISFSSIVDSTEATTVTRIGGDGAVTHITGLLLENLYYPGNQEVRDAVLEFDFWYNIWDEGQLNFISSGQAQIFAQAIFNTVSVLSFVNYNELFADKDWTYGGRNYCYSPYAIDQSANTMSAWQVAYHPINGWYTAERTDLSLDNAAFYYGIMFAFALRHFDNRFGRYQEKD